MLWMMQALRETCDLTLVTLGPVPLQALNEYYGTDLRPGDFRICRPSGAALVGAIRRAARLRAALLRRHFAAHAGRFDLLVSAYNPLDLGRAGLHFVADFSWVPELRESLHGSAPGAAAPLRGLPRKLYGSLTTHLGSSGDGPFPRASDVLVANSDYAARVLRQRCGVACAHVIHPPVGGGTGGLGVVPSTLRFASLGRVAPEKRIEDQIDILAGVRARGHDVSLRILGGPTTGACARALRRRLRREGPWVRWVGWVSGDAKWEALRACRFGLHTTRGEAFGIAVAEMMKCGCVPFVHREGAPAELVGSDDLIFASVSEAVDRIDALLRDSEREARLRADLLTRSDAYSTDSFCRRVAALVAAQLSAAGVSAAVKRGDVPAASPVGSETLRRGLA